MYFGIAKGKPNKFVLELLNFADDIVRGNNGQKLAGYSKIGWMHCL